MERPQFESLQWQQEYASGIEKLDKHRRKLVDIFNMMIERYNARVCKDNIAEPFFKLAFSAQVYFYDLDIMLHQLNYAGSSSKKKRHAAVLARIVKFKEDFTEKKETVCADMLEFMSEWLEGEILQMDDQVLTFLKAKGVA